MELHQLRTFAAVAEEGRLTRAAERLHISQPAVSGHIRALEQDLGIVLFRRTSKGMVLTGEGGVLLERTRAALDSLDEITVLARKLKGEIMGRVKIGLNTLASLLKAGELTGGIAARYPKISLHMTMMASGQVLDGVHTGELDGGFFLGNNPHPEIRSVFLRQADIVIAAPAGWTADGEQPDWEDMAGHAWIWTPEHCICRQAIQAEFEQCGRLPSKITTVEDDETMNLMICGGHGIGPMLRDEANRACERGEVVIVRSLLDTALSFGLLRSRENDPSVRAVLDVLGRIWGIDPFEDEKAPS